MTEIRTALVTGATSGIRRAAALSWLGTDSRCWFTAGMPGVERRRPRRSRAPVAAPGSWPLT